jgi:hypothetical protein
VLLLDNVEVAGTLSRGSVDVFGVTGNDDDDDGDDDEVKMLSTTTQH